jgi:hypothetical protein
METNQWIAIGIAVALVGVVVGVQYYYGWDKIGQKVMETFNFGDVGESFALVLTDSGSTGAQMMTSAQETESGGRISNLLNGAINRGKNLISSSPTTTTAVLMPVDTKALDELVSYGAISQADAEKIEATVQGFETNVTGVPSTDGSLFGGLFERLRNTTQGLVGRAKEGSAIKLNPIAYAQYVADKTNTTVELASLTDTENETALGVPLPFDFTNGLRNNGQMEDFSMSAMSIFSDPINALKYTLNLVVEAFEPLIEKFVAITNEFAVMVGLPYAIVATESEVRKTRGNPE